MVCELCGCKMGTFQAGHMLMKECYICGTVEKMEQAEHDEG